MTRVAATEPEDLDWEAHPLPAVPDYPVGALTGPLRKLVDSTPLPSALVAGAGLAALAAVCGAADLLVYDDEVRPSLWVPLIGPVSSGKTPSLRYAFAALRKLEREANTGYRAALVNWKASGGQPDKPADPTRLLTDLTMEKLLRMLSDNPERAQVHDELAALIKAVGQYKPYGGDRDKWLELWSGEPYRYSRVTGDIDYYIDRPVLSVCGGLQTERTSLLGGDEDGQRARWFPHAVDREIEDWAENLFEPWSWNKVIGELYRNTEPRRWELTGGVLEAWQRAAKRWKAEARGGENEMATAALHKADQQCARVVLVLVESLDPGAGGPVPAAAMEQAIAITDYVMDVWRSMDSPENFAVSLAGQKTWEAVQKWAAYAGAQPDRRVRARDLQRGKVGGVRNAASFAVVLDAYADHYPGRVVTEPTGRGGSVSTWVMAPERKGQR